MKSVETSATGLAICLALAVATSASAQPRAHGPARPRPTPCCDVPAGTVVEIAVEDGVSSKDAKSGDTFALRLAAPVIVDGKIVLRAGTPGVGEVIDAAKPGMGGKAGKLVLAARYLEVGGRHVPLQSLKLALGGHDNSATANAVGLTGFVFMPLGFAGLAVSGGNATVDPGTVASAKIADDETLPSIGRASSKAIADAAAFNQASMSDDTSQGDISISSPPPGQGEVVFFRAKSLMGTGQWFKVRENGAELGKLTNGAYFVQVAAPGVHTYTATTEPEAKDHLKLEIDPGETYYVVGTLTKGIVIGTADLTPSDRAAFDKASKDLKLAPPPSAETADDDKNAGSDDTNDATTAAAPATNDASPK